MTQLLDEKQAAALLHVSIKSLQGWRVRGGGPPFVKLGRCVRYALADLEAFVQDAVRRSTSDDAMRRSQRGGIRTEPLLERLGRTPLKSTADTGCPPPHKLRSSGAYMAPTLEVDTRTASPERPKK